MRARDWIGLLVSASAFTPITVHSQEVGEVVVTAQKRETVLEKTPATVNVVSKEFIESRGGAVELRQITAAVPSLVVNDGVAGLVGISLRGVGTASTNQLLEQTVGLFIDGVYYPKSIQYRSGLLDAARIEVIKGSQGVLFGENTAVGAISIVPNMPSGMFGGYLEGRYEPVFGSWDTSGVVNLPVTDKLAIRLAGDYSDSEGYVRDVYQRLVVPTETRYVTRGIARWRATDRLTATLKLQYSSIHTLGDGYQVTDAGSPAALDAYGYGSIGATPYYTATGYQACGVTCGQIFGPGVPINYTRSFLPTGTSILMRDASLRVDYEFPSGLTITSISGYEHFKYFNAFDSDQSPAPIFEQQFLERFSQGTEELRIASPTGGRFDFLGGIFLLTQLDDFTASDVLQHFLILGPTVDMTGVARGTLDSRTNSEAVFGQGTYHITPKLALTAGLRLSNQVRTGSYSDVVNDYGDPQNAIHFFAPSGPPLYGRIHDQAADFSFNLNFHPTDQTLLYASIARGQKSGAFNNAAASFTYAPDPFIVKPQETYTYETGGKFTFLGGAAYLGGSLYYLNIDNFQDSFYNAAIFAFQVRNINASSYGGELEGHVRLAPWASLWATANLNHAELADGETMQRAPHFAGTIGGRFTWTPPVPGVVGFFEPTVSYTTQYYTQSVTASGDNIAIAHETVDTRFGAKLTKSGVEVALLIENLTDARYKVMSFGSFEGLGTLGLYDRPRSFNISIRVPFGK
jgi:iron complex outermembrane receptor protein